MKFRIADLRFTCYGVAVKRVINRKTRHIQLGEDESGSLIWSCSSCKWATPFLPAKNCSIKPEEVLASFNSHRCESALRQAA